MKESGKFLYKNNFLKMIEINMNKNNETLAYLNLSVFGFIN